MNIGIIGGGASGLMAAITAAENGHGVTLFERQARVGRKLLSTGNGRCNLSNRNAAEKHYHGKDQSFIRPALEAFTVSDTLKFFKDLSLVTVTEPDGKIYPFSDQAGSVVDVLRFGAEAAGVNVLSGYEVSSVLKSKKGFSVKTENGEFSFDKLIICCGGMAGAKVGGTNLGYGLLKSLGHSITKLYPALVQIKTDNTYVRSLKGVRADAKVSLFANSRLLAESSGEVQFTDYGVSGPAVFEISRAASFEKSAAEIRLDLMREFSLEEIISLAEKRCESNPQLTLENLLTGVLHNRLGRTVIRYAGCDLNSPLCDLSHKDIAKIAGAVKDMRLKVIDTLSFDYAQVTAGGADTSEFDPETLESRIVPGLYAAGEVLDVDGDCGGFNLQWAWSSGRLAGRLL